MGPDRTSSWTCGGIPRAGESIPLGKSTRERLLHFVNATWTSESAEGQCGSRFDPTAMPSRLAGKRSGGYPIAASTPLRYSLGTLPDPVVPLILQSHVRSDRPVNPDDSAAGAHHEDTAGL